MVFHGNQGSSRHRKGRILGGSRGRGRERGGEGPIFDSARIAEQNKMNLGSIGGQPTNQDESDEDLQSEVVSSDEDEVEVQVVRPYTSLLQSLVTDSKHLTKRRKLDTTQGTGIGGNSHEEEVTFNALNEVDQVEEAEEGPELAVDGILEEEHSDTEDTSDPFEAHFAKFDGDDVAGRLRAIQKGQWTTQKTTISSLEKVMFAVPEAIRGAEISLPEAISGPEGLKLKQKLSISITGQKPIFSPLEKSLAPCIFNYHDIFFCERTPLNSESIRRIVCLHAINHVFKTRDRVIKNNARLAKEENNSDLDLRDQGFTRPKVLMLLPTRESCVRMVSIITSLCEPEQQENRKRFEDSYVEKEKKFSDDRPEDFRELFGGNSDDMFRLGMKFTRKTIKYFSQFYNSDIIFASPLGLRMAIATGEDKKVDYDFLSSIEIVIVDQADALLMQNWEHVEFIFEHLGLQPKEAHGCDFSRVRNWYLDDNAKYFRQNIAVASFNTPELNTLFWNRSRNWAGKIKFCKNYPGTLQELGLKVKQTFSRLDSLSFATDPDTRFTYFTSAIIPLLTRHSKDITGILIFVPSYLDFVRVRNYFSASATASTLSFGCISEYTSARDVARARSHFLTGRQRVLVYTERAHHFRRYQLKGVKKVIMYGLPDNPTFYKEIVGEYLGRSVWEGQLKPGEGKVRVLFSKWDILKLERVAGTERVSKMIKEKGDTFDFI